MSDLKDYEALFEQFFNEFGITEPVLVIKLTSKPFFKASSAILYPVLPEAPLIATFIRDPFV